MASDEVDRLHVQRNHVVGFSYLDIVDAMQIVYHKNYNLENITFEVSNGINLRSMTRLSLEKLST